MTEIPNPWDAERLDCGSQVIAVSGAIGFEQVEYPTRKFEPTLGGSGLYAAIASAFYGQTRLIGTVGTDASFTAFRTTLPETLNTEYVNIVPGTSFRWRARYLDCDAPPTTLSTSLGVLRHSRAAPIIRDSKVLLCSNEDPAFQHTLVASLSPKFLIYGVSGVWLSLRCREVQDLANQAQVVLLSATELRQWTGLQQELFADRFVIVSRASEGVEVMFGEKRESLPAPAVPSEQLVDVTGAGDVLAGSVAGYLGRLAGPITFDNVVAAVKSAEVPLKAKLCSYGAEAFAAHLHGDSHQ